MEEFSYKNCEIFLMLGDITTMPTDAIVNAANSTLLGGSGVDGAIHRVGGPLILEQCKKLNGCETGQVKMTLAGNLPSKYVIHAVGPVYSGEPKDEELLYLAYYNALSKAKSMFMRSIAFPAISTGAYGYPIEKATPIVIKALREFEDETMYPIRICFVLYDLEKYEIYKRFFESEFS